MASISSTPPSTSIVTPPGTLELSPSTRSVLSLTPISSASRSSLSTSSNPTSSSIPAPVQSIPPPSPTSQQQRQHDTLVHLYFLFLFLGGAALATLGYFILRRRKTKQGQIRRQRQYALTQDVHNWRSFGGFRRSERHEEGLDERGEAPPPYSAPVTLPMAQEAHLRGHPGRVGESRATFAVAAEREQGIAIPLRTLSRTGRLRPPEYEERQGSSRGSSLPRPPPHTRR
ncbi:MAG: hypothetical protein M1814_004958 [Vezdaea aestivalis]|nr:MAG: hypothetical protein M1814_004958 [Vezdaea aestivalis]